MTNSTTRCSHFQVTALRYAGRPRNGCVRSASPDQLGGPVAGGFSAALTFFPRVFPVSRTDSTVIAGEDQGRFGGALVDSVAGPAGSEGGTVADIGGSIIYTGARQAFPLLTRYAAGGHYNSPKDISIPPQRIYAPMQPISYEKSSINRGKS
jgi:hypothetical protein